jgi:hypothetical protein
MKKILLVLCLGFIIEALPAQTVLLSKKVTDYSIPGKKGPNLKRYTHAYMGFGFIFPANTSKKMDYFFTPFKSYAVNFGIRTKWKLAKFYAIGMDYILWYERYYELYYPSYDIIIDYDPNYLRYYPYWDTPDKSIHKTYNYYFSPGIYNRFNFGKRGNYIGTYLDIGIRLNCSIYSNQKTADYFGDTKYEYTYHSDFKDIFEDLPDSKPEAYVRFGINRYVLFVNYRDIDLYCPLTVGLEIGLF